MIASFLKGAAQGASRVNIALLDFALPSLPKSKYSESGVQKTKLVQPIASYRARLKRSPNYWLM